MATAEAMTSQPILITGVVAIRHIVNTFKHSPHMRAKLKLAQTASNVPHHVLIMVQAGRVFCNFAGRMYALEFDIRNDFPFHRATIGDRRCGVEQKERREGVEAVDTSSYDCAGTNDGRAQAN